MRAKETAETAEASYRWLQDTARCNALLIKVSHFNYFVIAGSQKFEGLEFVVSPPQ